MSEYFSSFDETMSATEGESVDRRAVVAASHATDEVAGVNASENNARSLTASSVISEKSVTKERTSAATSNAFANSLDLPDSAVFLLCFALDDPSIVSI